jgi:thiamine biosynthesis lipoprotein
MTSVARWRDWSTDVHVVVHDARDLGLAVELTRRRMAQVDRACSRFRADSETAQLRPGRQQVSSLLASLVGAGIKAANDTDGLVDPALGTQLRLAGYDRTFEAIGTDGPPPLFQPSAGRWREIRLLGNTLTMPSGLELDLGATAKAWLVDDVAARLSRRGVAALVNVGGDLAVSAEVPPGGWSVEVGDPGAPTQVVATQSALATSSTVRRGWVRDGQALHHVLDPRTGAPAEPYWRTASVAADTCVAANTASTAALILGSSAPEWLEARGLSCRLVARTGAVVTVCGWPADRYGRVA